MHRVLTMAAAVELGSVSTGLRVMFAMLTPNESSFEKVEDVPKYVHEVSLTHRHGICADLLYKGPPQPSTTPLCKDTSGELLLSPGGRSQSSCCRQVSSSKRTLICVQKKCKTQEEITTYNKSVHCFCHETHNHSNVQFRVTN